MKKITAQKLNLLLAVGLISIIAGLFLIVWYAASVPSGIPFFSAAVILTGALFLYLSLVLTHRTSMLYIGLVICAVGILNLLIVTNLIPCTMKELWPVIVVFCGISLFPASFFRYHRVRTVYLFPAILLFVLGIFFLFFSLHIIQISFTRFVAVWWPILLIIFGTALVVVFLYQQHCSNQPFFVSEENPETLLSGENDGIDRSSGDLPE